MSKSRSVSRLKYRWIVIYVIGNAVQLLCRKAKPAYCTPTRHVHSGQVLGNEIRRVTDRAEIIYQFSYECEPFWDKEYQSTASNELSWSRISFTLTCPQCGKATERSTQQNIVRPWICVCDCGYLLYVDDEETPVFDSVEEFIQK